MTRKRRSRTGERALWVAGASATLVLVALLVLVLGDAVTSGGSALTWTFLSQPPRDGMRAGGVLPAIVGTALLTLGMTVVAVPAGVATAVWLVAYVPTASRRATLVRVAVANLAAVPAVVFGLFGLGFFVSVVGKRMDAVLQTAGPVWGKPALVWSALTLALLTLPVVVVSAEQAMRTVPRDLLDASLALGATRWQTIVRVLIPEALPGIMTGTVLAIGRGAGEVAPILFTGVAYYLPSLPTSPADPFMSLGYHAYVLATQSPDPARTRPLLGATVLMLLAVTLAASSAAIVLRSRARGRR